MASHALMGLLPPVRTWQSALELEHIKKLMVGLVAAFVVLEFGRSIYNVFFHPLRKFPGPLLAAVTPWWKTYEEVGKGTSLYHKLVDLHAIYGPIIRISPDEVLDIPIKKGYAPILVINP